MRTIESGLKSRGTTSFRVRAKDPSCTEKLGLEDIYISRDICTGIKNKKNLNLKMAVDSVRSVVRITAPPVVKVDDVPRVSGVLRRFGLANKKAPALASNGSHVHILRESWSHGSPRLSLSLERARSSVNRVAVSIDAYQESLSERSRPQLGETLYGNSREAFGSRVEQGKDRPRRNPRTACPSRRSSRSPASSPRS